MTEQKLTPEQIHENWTKFRSLLEKLGDRSDFALKLADVLEERLALCPASGRTSYHNCFPGGLVDHSLRVLGNAFKLVKLFNVEISRESLIVSCLMHDLGKVGDLDTDYYVPQESDWHREKLGEFYKINDKIKFMSVTDRSLMLCQHFGLKLSVDEWLAIKLSDGQYVDENRAYRMHEPPLAIIVHQADMLAAKQESGQIV